METITKVIVTPEILSLIDRAIAEDLHGGDQTTEVLISSNLVGKAVVLAKSDGIIAGIDVALAVFSRVDPNVVSNALIQDGSTPVVEDIGNGIKASFILETVGPIASILAAERTAMNFLQHLSGIATHTSKYVEAVKGYNVVILDTRKTTPGLRTLEKYAVRVGGGTNHRNNLGDGILIKDNHIEAMKRQGLKLGDIVKIARAGAPHMLRVEVEVEDLKQVEEALNAGAEVLLLDNMGLREMCEAVEMTNGQAVTEASGGITLQNVRDVAATGVNMISVGALTHSSSAFDVSLELL